MDYPIEHIVSCPDARTAYIKAKDQIFKYTWDGKFEQTNITISKPCVQIEVVKIDLKDTILALSLENSFLIDGKEIAKNITSFYVHSDFLLLTTMQHTLICVTLNQFGIKQLSKHDLTIKPWLNNTNEILFKGEYVFFRIFYFVFNIFNFSNFKCIITDIYIRRLEKDSYIVTAIPYESKVILQMSRGNLECIQPRALSLHIIKRYLDKCDYLAAFGIMIKQRINLNLIYDHDPQLFLNNVKKFIESIVQNKKLNWLNMFLSDLQNEDVSNTMYAYCYTDRTVKSDVRSNKITANKIDGICEILRNVMQKRNDADNLMQPILISFVKNQQRQGLEDALRKVKQLKVLEDSRQLHGSAVSAFEALKYLLLFINIDKLYDVALGMYDLDLVMFIASKSSKDPKDYLPFLNSLKKLNENYMKYSINIHLKRYDSALECLSKDKTKFKDCLDLIHNQKLYKTAMKLFEKNTTEYRKVASAYGEFLLSEQKYLEAGIMFYRSGDLNKALETFNMSSDNWQDVIAISKEMKLR